MFSLVIQDFSHRKTIHGHSRTWVDITILSFSTSTVNPLLLSITRNQPALNGPPSTSTKWVREPRKLDICWVDFHFFAPFLYYSITRLNLGDLWPHERWHHRGHQTWQRPPLPTAQLRFNRSIRQGLLPPTAISGVHPNESHGDRLAREILNITDTGLLQDFNNWRSIHRPQSPTTKAELDHILQQYFDEDTSNHLSATSRTNFSKYMLDFYDVANTYAAQKLQCQYCKKRFAKHFLMPMYPKFLHRNDTNTYMFCWGCLQAANGRDHMIHPGPWLNTTQDSEDANIAPILDLSVVSNRPWALQSLDEDFDADFVPFVWIPAVDDQAQAYYEATFSHFWDNQQNRWRRTSLTCPRPILYSRCTAIPKPYRSYLEEPIWKERWPSPILCQVWDLRPSPPTDPKPVSRPPDQRSQDPSAPDLEIHIRACHRQLFPFEGRPTRPDPEDLCPMGDIPHQCQPSGHRPRPSPFSPFRQEWPVPEAVLDHRAAVSSSPFYMSQSRLQEGGPVTPLGHQRETRQTYPRPLPSPSLPDLLPPLGYARPPWQPTPTPKTMPRGQDQMPTTRPDRPYRPKLGPYRPIRHSLLFVLDGMAGRGHRWSSPDPQASDRWPFPSIRSRRGQDCLSARQDSAPFAGSPTPALHEKSLLEPRPYRRAWGPKPTGRLRDLCHPLVAQGQTCPWQATILRLVRLWIRGGCDPRPEAWTSDQVDGPHLLPPPGFHVRQREPPRTQTVRDHAADEPSLSTSPTDLSDHGLIPGGDAKVTRPMFYLRHFLLRLTHDNEFVLIPGGEVNSQLSHPDGRIEVESRWWLLFSMP